MIIKKILIKGLFGGAAAAAVIVLREPLFQLSLQEFSFKQSD